MNPNSIFIFLEILSFVAVTWLNISLTKFVEVNDIHNSFNESKTSAKCEYYLIIHSFLSNMGLYHFLQPWIFIPSMSQNLLDCLIFFPNRILYPSNQTLDKSNMAGSPWSLPFLTVEIINALYFLCIRENNHFTPEIWIR